ncbi:MAG TPA: phospholipase D-like domain-containing protein [Gammaproteobacteria bacterium]|nr:phospholipase D-like domain-containing protein [Gammaproteobacteria bacterium]
MTSLSPWSNTDNSTAGPEISANTEQYALYVEGDILFDAMLAVINNAQHQVWLATYIFSGDEIGQQFVKALSAKAKAGMDVRLTVDALGSFFLFPRNLEKELTDQGVKVRRYHRWSWRKPLRYNSRDHRKLLIVDGQQAFLGGFNIHRECSLSAFGKERWRDTHVRITGELAIQAMELFAASWEGKPYRCLSPREAFRDELLPNKPLKCRWRLRRIYRNMMNDARRYLYVSTPYFVPDRLVQKGLVAAARRGVDVRVLVPRKSDVLLVQWASRAAYANLLLNGVRIYEYLPRMLHAKTIVIDDEYATIGTSNIDYRSFFLNHELNLFSENPYLCLRLYHQFNSDMKEAEEVHPKSWKRRPWLARVLEWAGWMARRWL